MATSKIGPRLQQMLDHPPVNAVAEVTIKLVKETASLFSDFPAARQLAQPARRLALERIAEEIAQYQSSLISSLDGVAIGPIRSLWMNNVVGATLPLAHIHTLVKREEVRYVEVTSKIPLQRVIDHAEKLKRKKPKIKAKIKIKKPRKPAAPVKTIVIKTEPDHTAMNVVNYSQACTYIDRNIEIIGAPELWKSPIGLTGKDVIVAVIDTGINHDHLHLKDRMWDDGTADHGHGFNSVLGNKDTMDTHSHGTACAGIIAGQYTGVAREATLMAIKALETKDYFDTTIEQDELNIWAGIEFVLLNGCHLISMSISIKHEDDPNYLAWREVCDTLYQAGVMHVNSTGKLGGVVGKIDPATHLPYPSDLPNNIPAPANCPPPWLHPEQLALAEVPGLLNAVVACGCCNNVYYLVDYSGRGPSDWTDFPYTKGTKSGLLKPDLVAPGVQVRSCELSGGILPRFSGTSAATPHVAGAVALLMQACLNAGVLAMPLDQILEALSTKSLKLSGQAADGMLENGYGAGCINVYDAYLQGKANGWW